MVINEPVKNRVTVGDVEQVVADLTIIILLEVVVAVTEVVVLVVPMTPELSSQATHPFMSRLPNYHGHGWKAYEVISPKSSFR